MDREFVIDLIAYDTFDEASRAAQDLATKYDVFVDVHQLSTGRWRMRGPAALVGVCAWLSEGTVEHDYAEEVDPASALKDAERLVDEGNALQRVAFSFGRGPVLPEED